MTRGIGKGSMHRYPTSLVIVKIIACFQRHRSAQDTPKQVTDYQQSPIYIHTGT